MLKVVPGGEGDILRVILVGFRRPCHRRTYSPAPAGRQVKIYNIGWRIGDCVLRGREWRGIGVMSMHLGTGHSRQGQQGGEKVGTPALI
jgi:hypothetical protein